MSAQVAYMQMSAREAEVITEQIVGRIDQLSENVDTVRALIRDALARRADLALGYASPTAYVADRFDGALANLSAALRQEIVHELSNAGFSTRAIAPIVGVSNKTVHQDLRDQVLPEVTPAPPVVNDVSKIAHLPEPAPEPEVVIHVAAETGEVIDAPTVTEHTVTEKTKVTGLDGKTYTKPAPKADRRRSLVDDAYKARTDLWKAIESIRTISNDDRFTRNKADILAALQPSADLAIEILADLFDNSKEEK